AHNARFDYAFIKNAMKLAGINFKAKTLCTMRLSRYFYPSERHHHLAAIKSRFALTHTNDGHRAGSDVACMYAFFNLLKQQQPADAFHLALQKISKQSALPQHLALDLKQAIPNTS